MKKIFFSIFLVLISSLSFTATFEGTGYGRSSDEARVNSINELTISLNDNYIKKYPTSDSQTSLNNLDLIFRDEEVGVEYKSKKYLFRKKYRVISKINNKNLKLYEDKSNFYRSIINSSIEDANLTKDLKKRKELLTEAINNMSYYNGYAIVAKLLDSKNDFTLKYSKEELEQKVIRINDILNTPKVIYIKITGDFPGEMYDYLKTHVNNLITSISKNSTTKILIVPEMSDEVNTLFNVNVNSFYINETAPITYNQKEIIGNRYEAFINISLSAKDTTINGFLISKTANETAVDSNSEKAATYKAIDLLFKKQEKELSHSFTF